MDLTWAMVLQTLVTLGVGGVISQIVTYIIDGLKGRTTELETARKSERKWQLWGLRVAALALKAGVDVPPSPDEQKD